MISVSEALARVTYTKEEEKALTKLESVVDAALYSKFDGAPFTLKFDEVVPGKIAYALQRRYESKGGWRVNIMRTTETSCTFTFIPVIFTLLQPKTASTERRALPPVMNSLVPTSARNRLLVRMPTRERPSQAIDVLTKYRSMAGTNTTIEVVIDVNDETTNTSEVLQRFNALGCVITVGQHANKIEAVNGGRVKDWDILMLASDDMVPVADDYAVRIIEAMDRHWPHLDGAIYFDDGHQGANLCTLPIIGRRLYDQFGYIYEPIYQSLFSDREQTDLWLSMGRLTYVGQHLIEHRHPIWGGVDKDALYTRNDEPEPLDKAYFSMRRGARQANAQFAFNAPPLWLSIGICTTPDRRARLDRLVDHLYTQIQDYPRQVEIVIDNRVEPTIGEKRQALLERAKGHFIAFVDDDDWVAHDYVSRVVSAIKAHPDTDCTSLNGIMTTAGGTPERFEHSVKHSSWFKSGDGIHCRNPNHLNAVRRSLALRVGFTSKSHGEDFDYSMALRPLVSIEAQTGEAPLYYYWYDPLKAINK